MFGRVERRGFEVLKAVASVAVLAGGALLSEAVGPTIESAAADAADIIGVWRWVADVPSRESVEVQPPMLEIRRDLNGALELLPQSLATMAIIPLQMKMVYRIGTAHGFELDRGHIKDFLATVGVGLTSQYVERIGRRLVGGMLGGLGGRLARGLGSAATGSAFSFATTYALGKVAVAYYAGGRTLDGRALKETFASLLGEAKTLQTSYLPQIQERARTIDTGELLQLVRSPKLGHPASGI